MDKDQYIAKIKIEHEDEKKTTEYQENKADSRINKVKGYNEFMNWYTNWDGSIIKAREIKVISGINTEDQWKTLRNNKIIQSNSIQWSKVKEDIIIRKILMK